MWKQEVIRESGLLADIQRGRISMEEDRCEFPPILTWDVIDENVENTTGFRLEYNPPCSALDV
jgi:hypothetical protein